MKVKINPVPYLIECKDIEAAKERYKHLGELTSQRVPVTFNALNLKENQFFVKCENENYYLVTIKTN